ncbi:tetratricopeptide repeat protein [Subsaxibacter sp. CAU 1640]|uniref:tetratricopeptide repeat protein n=1 Tax=Subsaxibacter sp. CAU 1640 TaxID=2933271 RepID=UPI0020033C07|nr:tetratricopeptide repeat protein [Subsaxibacter sp. CAU 1640]MCK7589651.1 tetratricopeptide repeat protein [Subsaxibacter sp. CAU 1640]
MEDNSNISQELLETIERYYNGSMSKDELEKFENKLEQDNVFKSQVEDIKTLLFGIESQSLKEKLDEFHKEIPLQEQTVETSSKVRRLDFWKYATAAVIVIGLGCFWFLSGSSNERLFNNHFTPDPGLPTTMSSSDNFDFFDAMVNYKEGNYQKAIEKWEKLELKQPENDTISYFLGVAYLAKKEEASAIKYLEKTTQTSNSVFMNDANYYLGLAYLKAENTEKAIEHLEMSSSDDSKELLKKLK